MPCANLVCFSNHQYFNQPLVEVFNEFAANGISKLTLDDEMILHLLEDASFKQTIQAAIKNSGCYMIEAHGLRGPEFDLGIIHENKLSSMIKAHSQAINLAAEFGTRNYVIHLGAAICYQERRPPFGLMRQNSWRVIEKLLPVAEKAGMVIALENSFEPSNTPEEVLHLLNKFRHKNLGCCFDVGHANIMSARENLKAELFDSGIVQAWNGKLIMEDDALGKLASEIVTVHLHDNNGYSDQHNPPGAGLGTVDWGTVMHRLNSACPRLYSIQNETKQYTSDYSIAMICKCSQQVFRQMQ